MSFITELLKMSATQTKKAIATASETGSPGGYITKNLEDMFPYKTTWTSMTNELPPYNVLYSNVKNTGFNPELSPLIGGGINIVWYGLGAFVLLSEIDRQNTKRKK